MKDTKPPNWAKQGTAKPNAAMPTHVDSSNGKGSPRADRREVNAPHQKGTSGRKTFPNLPMP